jgi:hypothetical protein
VITFPKRRQENTVIDKKLLDILACPVCKTRVELVGEHLVCAACGRKYPVRDGIPIMLVEKAQPPRGGEQESREKRCQPA